MPWEVKLPPTVNLEIDILRDLDTIREVLGTTVDCGARDGDRYIRCRYLKAPWHQRAPCAQENHERERLELVETMWASHEHLSCWALHRWSAGAHGLSLTRFLRKMAVKAKTAA